MRPWLLLLPVLFVGCAERATPPEFTPGEPAVAAPPRTIDQSLKAAGDYLVKQQSPDGWWRSDVYAAFKDGKALTPFAVVALQSANLAPEARKRGAGLLAKMARPDGTIDEGEDGIDYPAYTASLSVIALSHPENQEHLKARDAWVDYLRARQLTEPLGWDPEDPQYGGWGYCRVLPRKPEPNRISPPLIESNLSATLFALEALRAAGSVKGDEAALKFVRSCQNPDGGFHFIYDDPVRNKAGSQAGPPIQFHSYGSTTADGLRALTLSAHPLDELAEIPDAQHWLKEHFRPDTHPGIYVPAHERHRDAVYFYYAASVARALRGSPAISTPPRWSDDLAKELLKRQREDGSWANPVELVRENDPIVATGHAMIALAQCRAAGAK